MSMELNNSESLKKEMKEALDESFGPLLLQIAKMIKEMSETIKSQQSVNEIITAKINLVYSLQSELQAKMIEFETLPDQFDKLDKNLAKFLQKSMQDTRKLQEQFNSLIKEPIIQYKPSKEQIVVQEAPKVTEHSVQADTSDLIANLDSSYIKDLIAEFAKKDVYTTEAIRMIENTRDKLLFERDDEVPYRANGAKIFREVLAIVKQEKDFRTISPMAAEDIKKRLSMLLEYI